MISGVISIILGSILVIMNLVKGTDTVQQQAVQYLGFVCGSIFLVGGMILLKLQTIDKNLLGIFSKLDNIDENIEIVHKEKIFEESSNS